MNRILFILLTLVAGYFALRALRRRVKSDSSTPSDGKGQAMVACAHCGVFLPEVEAVTERGVRYCSREHLALGPGGKAGRTRK